MTQGLRDGRPSLRPAGAPGAPGRGLGRRLLSGWRRTSLLARFTVIGLLLTIMIGLVLGTVVARRLERSGLAQAAERTAEDVGLDVDPFLRPEDFAGVPSPERSQAIDRHIRQMLPGRHIVKVKIWNPAGMVIYSTDRAVVGRQFAVVDELADALKGEIGMDISDLSKEENQRERGRYARLLEVYVPIRLGGERVVGAYELYWDMDALALRIAATQRFLWLGLVLGLGALYLALFGVVRSASRQLHRQSEELGRLEARREIDRLTTEFVSIVSHELWTPLAALVGFSELLLTGPADAAEQREWTENMHASAKRLSELVEDLLEVSRIEEGRVELKRRPVDARAAVAAVLADFRFQAAAHRIDQRWRGTIPPVLADPDRLPQVLTNLLSNAIKYSPQGGPITISIAAGDDTVHLSVADQGLGLPREELPRIFDRFHRLQDEARRGIPGTGLGLYITKRLVELQEGRIWAESAGPGRGSTFHVTLPAASAEQGHG